MNLSADHMALICKFLNIILQKSTKTQRFHVISKNIKPNYSNLTVTSCPKIDKKTCQGNRKKIPKHENVCEIIYTSSEIFLFFSFSFFSLVFFYYEIESNVKKIKVSQAKNTHFLCMKDWILNRKSR